MSADGVLAGRLALVTGASGGIGAAICRRLASEGASVAAAYGASRADAEELAAELTAAGTRADAFSADLASAEGPAQLLAEVESALGGVDVLVANHGVGRRRDYEQVSVRDWDHTLAVNLRAPFLLAQGALAGMRARGFGRILFVSSLAAFRGGVLAPDYAASKAGLHGLAHFLAPRAGADGVTVNVLAPGFIETAMLPGDPAQLGAGIPVGRVGTPEEAAMMAVAMLANGYLNNQVVALDGGSYPR